MLARWLRRSKVLRSAQCRVLDVQSEHPGVGQRRQRAGYSGKQLSTPHGSSIKGVGRVSSSSGSKRLIDVRTYARGSQPMPLSSTARPQPPRARAMRRRRAAGALRWTTSGSDRRRRRCRATAGRADEDGLADPCLARHQEQAGAALRWRVQRLAVPSVGRRCPRCRPAPGPREARTRRASLWKCPTSPPMPRTSSSTSPARERRRGERLGHRQNG